MKLFWAVWIWVSGVSATDGINVSEHEGKRVTITCIHSWASTNRKYFCRDPCNNEDVLVSSDQSLNGRFRLKDSGDGTFTVSITDLQETDSGVYWCGVDRTGADTYHKINLRVSKVDTHTPERIPTAVANPDPQTSSRRPFTPAPDNITTLFTFAEGPHGTSRPAVQTLFEKAGALVCTAATLTVIVMIFGGILCVYKKRKRKSHSSSGPTQTDAEKTTEMAHVYGNITENQQLTDTHTTTIVYSAVNQHSAANQTEDSILYSNLPIQPLNCTDQSHASSDAAPSITYAAINTRNKRSAAKTFPAEDRVTYDTVCVQAV